MTTRPKKAMIFGIDAPIAPRLYKYCKEGKLPTLARIIDNGVWAKYALVPLPTITPTGWTSISTGAWPGTHCVTDFNVHNPGDSLDVTHPGFLSGDVKAEYVWNAIARAGKKSVIVNYPTTWPPNIKDGYQIGGAGVSVNMWLGVGAEADQPLHVPETEMVFPFTEHGAEVGRGMRWTPWNHRPLASLSYAILFSTKKFEKTPRMVPRLLELREPSGWSNVPSARRALEADVVVTPSGPRYEMETPVWHMLVLDTKGEGYDRVVICEAKDAASPMADLRLGQWSPVITREFQTEVGPKKASFALKLQRLSKDAQDLLLYHSAICALDGWAYPESLAAEIKSEKGMPFYGASGFHSFNLGYGADTDTLFEIAEFERQWLSDACTYILKNKPWDLFMMHYHLPDGAYHTLEGLVDAGLLDPGSKLYQEIELGVYQKCDQLAADLLACVDEDETVFAMTSDHGATGHGPELNRQNILEEAGLMVRDKDGKVDWSKTKAYAQRVVYVYVNLKGRDPHGIVEPGEEYSQVQEEIIKALTDYVSPVNGKRPIRLALRKEDARVLGLYGDYVGDVVYAMREDFNGTHGPMLPTGEFATESGMSSAAGIFAIAGPGIKKGVELERNVQAVDLVPTICYLLGWPMPKDAEGAVIYQALEDPK